MNKLTKYISRPQVWGFFVSIAVMALLSIAFFYPDNFDGNVLRQPDMQQGAANGHEAELYHEATGEKALWTDALFGGMPTFQISPSYPSNDLFTWINTAYGLGLPAPSNLLFMMMFGFLILLYVLGLRWYYALIGAVAWGFSSYFVIIIGAGHIWKFLALTYIPPTIGGFILLYKNRWLLGTALTSLFAMLQLNANHPQMTYYLGLVMVIIAICYLIQAIKDKKLKQWAVASCLAVASGLLAFGANAPSLYNTYEYSKETKRSQSELTPLNADEYGIKERPTGGLPKSEIVGWSYGPSEMFSLLIPNIKGGASARPEGGKMVAMTLSKLDDAEQYKATSPLLPYLSQYFNDSEGTNGPVYVGVIIFALFILGCIIVKGPIKWAMLTSTILAALLSLGYNAEWLSDFMIYNFPMYSKFRAVESILVVVEFAMPLMAVLALAKVCEAGVEAWNEYKKPIVISFAIPLAFSCLAFVAPSVYGPAITQTDLRNIESLQSQVADMAQKEGYNQSQVSEIMYHYSLANPQNAEAVNDLRYGMVKDDAWRSIVLLLLALGTIVLMTRNKVKYGVGVAAVGLLVTIDLYTADKRYVSHSSFGPADSEGGAITFVPDQIDSQIMVDGGSDHYRVFDIPGFSSADRSYFHNMVGGYHAAKLNRYEDLIQRKIMPMLQIGYYPNDPDLDDPEFSEVANQLRTAYAVADMLNSRYIITGTKQAPVVRNDNALGNAWLVDSILWVDGADAEMQALNVANMNFAHHAVADRAFADALSQVPSIVPGDSIFLTEYTPNRLTYQATTTAGGIGVFSEIYFPWGWKATIDGEPAPLARVNYVLRALAIPAGTHTIAMSFEPDSIRTSSAVAYACVTLIYLLLAAALFFQGRKWKLY